MESIVYRGHQNFMRVECPSRMVYEFKESNKYTVKPQTFEDLYFILLLDNSPFNRNFVIKGDPLCSTNDRRIYVDTNVIDPTVIQKQMENEARQKKVMLYESYKKEYIDRLFNRIAVGAIDENTKEPVRVPSNLDELAEEYAKEKMDLLEPKEEPINTEPTDDSGKDSKENIDLEKLNFNQLLELAKELEIEVPTTVKSKDGVRELIREHSEKQKENESIVDDTTETIDETITDESTDNPETTTEDLQPKLPTIGDDPEVVNNLTPDNTDPTDIPGVKTQEVVEETEKTVENNLQNEEKGLE